MSQVATAASPIEEQVPPLTSDAEFAAAETRVLYHETDQETFVITSPADPRERRSFPLRPLVLKHAKHLGVMAETVVKRVAAAQAKDAAAGELDEATECIAGIVLYLGQVYGTPVTREWLDNHATAEALHRLIDRQLAVQGKNDFLVSAVASISAFAANSVNNAEAVQLMMRRQAERNAELLQKATSSALSATRGTSDSPSSPSATPAAS